MKKDQSEYYVKKIIEYLLDGKVVATKDIADYLNLSLKSARNKIELTEDFLLEKKLGTIEKKPRVGIWLDVNRDKKDEVASFIKGNNLTVANDTKDRTIFVLKAFFKLFPQEAISIRSLLEQLYLSTPTVHKIIKSAQEWLDKFNIKIVNVSGRGYLLAYEENSYRLALKEFICSFNKNESIEDQVKELFYGINIELIKRVIKEVESDWNYLLTDESFYEIYVYCVLAVYRSNIAQPRNISSEDIETLQHYAEYQFAVAIFAKIQRLLYISISDNDTYFLATQIMCSRFINISNSEDSLGAIHKYDEKLVEFVDILIDTIGGILNVDLSNDTRLRDSLIFHLRPTIFRLRSGTPHENAMVDFIKSEYKNVFRATLSAAILFEKYFDIQITEDELAYVALYIQSALERKQENYKAVLVSNMTRGYVELVSSRITKNIPEIDEIKVVGRHDFSPNKCQDAQIIIADHPMNLNDPRLVIITNLLSDEGLLTLRSFMDDMNLTRESLKNTFSPVCHPLFDPELIRLHMHVKSKEELLRKMSLALEKKGYVKKEFSQTVLDREAITSTAIGNHMALPHGAESAVNESHVAIVTLDEPIAWDEDESVDIIFLLAIKLTTHEEIQRMQIFYKEYISLIENEEKVQKIRNTQSNLDLYRYLIR